MGQYGFSSYSQVNQHYQAAVTADYPNGWRRWIVILLLMVSACLWYVFGWIKCLFAILLKHIMEWMLNINSQN